MNQTITVMGFGLSEKDLSPSSLAILSDADVIVGGKRHLGAFPDTSAEKVVIEGKMSVVLDRLEGKVAEGRKVVILASGDPLYYGIGSLVTKRFGSKAVRVIPNVSAVAGAFSRLGLSWHDAGVVSLHGRGATAETLKALLSHEKTALFTDPKNSPDTVAAWLLEQGVTARACHVFEAMGTPEEKHTESTLELTAGRSFTGPNMMVILGATLAEPPLPIGLGMPSESFAHQRGMITKPEVRAVTLAKLGLKSHQVLWDLGAGSGSVSIEASRFVNKVCAVEQKPERVADIQANIRRFGALNMTVTEGALPDAARDLPDPDVVFIGGGGKDLDAIIRMASDRMGDNARMVVNTVLLQSLGTAVTTLEDEGFGVEVFHLTASVSTTVAWDMMLKGTNPVFIVTGIRGEG
ncbi:precorrin-6y C5,15-methyltransferase (decarboxylating) subunit CbiE [Desulfoluna spongiiphila]|uniref:precorrin-6y C5,15-methyltransferase (decarboxylating) subunit CbiE n=1 Tax=Desulfoluna spongiiphila TaxID=419481 RepID=UPI0012574329|nr:precorrin-6y C5,15-methyltransferase (decarboxylating) subunit CbiE [Desulfoluna spongiiphila]VVS90814.1 cobalamin (vitamin b12) biosynthesis cobl/precorrin-6y c(5 15)-methyltransferase [Desulfoluna spongiiphila]